MTATRNKRILSIQPVSDGGGSEHALITMIAQLGADGWDCHVALPGPARLASEYAAAGATLHFVAMPHLTRTGPGGRWVRFARSWPASVLALGLLARRLDVAVVHTNSLHSWYGWAVARMLRLPHVWHAREIVFQSAAALRVERFLARRFAVIVIAVSAAVAAQLDPANVVVVLDDADPGRFHPDRAGRFRLREGIDDSVPLVGSVARVDTWKGLDVLLEAFPAIVAGRPGTELVVAGADVPGKEAYAESLRERAAALGVRWLGPRSDIPELMADLDVFVQVSTEPEPFGLVVVEALASGVPVVAGAAGGPLEVLGPEAVARPVPAGRLVAPGDPAALAAAVVDLLAGGRSNTPGRRRRPPLRRPAPGRLVEVFDAVAGGAPPLNGCGVSRRPAAGRRRSGRQPPGPR